MTVLLDFEATGWKYISPVPAGTSWHDDESFDDTAWSTGQSAFGDTVGTPAHIHTLWPAPAGGTVALRRLLGAGSYIGAVLKFGADDAGQCWLNGTLIATKASPASEQDFTIPDSAWGNNNLLAVYGEDTLGGQRSVYVQIDVFSAWQVGSVAIG